MPYRSHPYPEGTAESPTYKVIYEYQRQHAAAYAGHIKLNRVVTRVRHTPGDRVSSQSKRWLVEWTPSVTSKSPDGGKTFEEEFDHIVVANGSDSRPFIPYIDKLWHWKGDILHSRWYRDPKAYAGKASLSLRCLRSQAENRDRPSWWSALDPQVSSLSSPLIILSIDRCRCGHCARTRYALC